MLIRMDAAVYVEVLLCWRGFCFCEWKMVCMKTFVKQDLMMGM